MVTLSINNFNAGFPFNQIVFTHPTQRDGARRKITVVNGATVGFIDTTLILFLLIKQFYD